MADSSIVFDHPNLASLLNNRRWVRSTFPFPHICADKVFTSTVYDSLERAYKAILTRGLSESPRSEGFSRSFAAYDAYGADLPVEAGNPLSVFVCREWHDMIARILDVDTTGDMNTGLHHHKAGSASGSVHNDLNPGWFVGAATPDCINVSNSTLCSYKFGDSRVSGGSPPRQTIRAIAMIFYLANRPWSPGDGGETGLYEAVTDPVDRPTMTVPPVNNSLLAFECTPFSFHSFLHNRYPRNCVVLWWHRNREVVVSRWGEQRIVTWKIKR